MSKRNKGKFEPRADDFFPTPFKAVEPLIPYLRVARIRTFADPCAGKNDLVRHLESLGFECVHSSDINRGQDVLDIKHFGNPDANITNPPHTRAILHDIIAHLVWTKTPTWLLIDHDWALTHQAAPYLPHCTDMVPIGRVTWIDGTKTNGFDNYCWYRFDINHSSGPVLHWHGKEAAQCQAQASWRDDRRDRATVAATAILQIITDAELEPDLAPGELHFRVWRYLCDELDDIALEITAEREVRDA